MLNEICQSKTNTILYLLYSESKHRASEYSSKEANLSVGFPGGASGKEDTCQCRRHER